MEFAPVQIHTHYFMISALHALSKVVFVANKATFAMNATKASILKTENVNLDQTY